MGDQGGDVRGAQQGDAARCERWYAVVAPKRRKTDSIRSHRSAARDAVRLASLCFFWEWTRRQSSCTGIADVTQPP
jgi:hypothetical protein